MDLIILFVFGCVTALILAIGSLGWRRPVKRRLVRLADGSMGNFSEPLPDEEAAGDAPSWLTRLLVPLAQFAVRGEDLRHAPVRRRLVEAGYRRPSAVIVYAGSRVALALLLPIVALLLSPMWSLTEFQLFSVLAVAVVLGLVGPSQYIDRQRAARQRRIILGLPDALDLMVVCVEAGLGINASLSRIAREFSRSNPILSAEFQLVILETRAGKSSTEALRALAIRTGVSEIGSLVAMLVQTERFGTNLADTLRVHADSLRVQRMQRAEEQAGKAPLKMMFPTLLIFAATLLVTLGPGLMRLMEFFTDGA
ncbi:MAG TPA: type II secretion system F family protein [Myxococcota bacterium]